jgi:hypothetical protein
MTLEPFFDVCPARFTCKRMNKRMKSVNFEQRPSGRSKDEEDIPSEKG